MAMWLCVLNTIYLTLRPSETGFFLILGPPGVPKQPKWPAAMPKWLLKIFGPFWYNYWGKTRKVPALGGTPPGGLKKSGCLGNPPPGSLKEAWSETTDSHLLLFTGTASPSSRRLRWRSISPSSQWWSQCTHFPSTSASQAPSAIQHSNNYS